MAALIFLPATIYLTFSMGTEVGSASMYITAILFTALARIYGGRLSKQELYIIYATVGAIATSVPFYYWLVFRSFFVTNPLSLEFKLFGTPLRELVPVWLSPPVSSPVHQLRTLMHPDWLPALVIQLTFGILGMIAEISLGMLFSYLYIEEEPLPFPIAEVGTAMINTLHEAEPNSLLYFLLSLIAGAIYGSLLHVVPMLLGAEARLIPSPWVDLTQYTQYWLPGAVIGISTDPLAFIFGMVLPPSLTVMMMIGSYATWVFGNTLTIKVFRDFAPQWAEEYSPGMNIFLIQQRAELRLWLSFFIGLSFGLALYLFITTASKSIKALKALTKLSKLKGGPGFPSAKVLILLYLASTSASAALYYILVPEIPFWMPIVLSIGLGFVIASINARTYGETAVVIGDYFMMFRMWRTCLYFSNYQGYTGWVHAPALSGGSTPYIVNTTKIAYNTQTKPIDYYKSIIITNLLVLTFGFIFVDFFWRIAPIPSSVFPYVMGVWPSYAVTDSLYTVRQIVIRADQILMGIGFALVSGFILYGLNRVGIPLSPVGLIVGMQQLPTSATMTFIMSIVSKYVMSRALGAERWRAIRGIVIAGFIAGISIAVILGLTITLISRSSWIWPW
ncbi:MAG: hypothetical protein QW734_06310 [Candidatus Bathyarchaeia archaeon]